MQSFRGSYLFSGQDLVHVWLLLFGWAWMAAGSGSAQEPKPENPKPYWLTADSERLQRVRQTEARLNQKVTFNFEGVPLVDALRELGKQCQVSFYLNEAELDTLGITHDALVHSANQSITLREGLNQLLKPLDLRILVHEADIEISSQDNVDSRPFVRVYDLAHFAQPSIQLQDLAQKISQIVQPDQWQDYGGSGNSVLIPFGSALVVSAPESVQFEVARILANLARTPSYIQASDAEHASWKTGKAFSIVGTATAESLVPGGKTVSGTIDLPEGATYELVRITQQSATSQPPENPEAWAKPDQPAPAWLSEEPPALDSGDLTRTILRQNIDTNFDSVALRVAIADLIKPLGPSVWLNEVELESLGLSGDTPITLHLKDSAVQTGLARMLVPLDLSYKIIGNSLEITSTGDAQAAPVARFYDLSALSDKPFDVRALMMLISRTVTPDEWRDWGGGGESTMIPFGAKLCVAAPESTIAVLDDLLCQLASLNPSNLPKAGQQQVIKIETVLGGIPGGSKIQLPTDGVYQLRRN